MKFINLVLLVVLLTGTVTLPAQNQEVQFQKSLTFSADSAKPASTWDFCETGDGIFIIPDYREGNIKIYERYGEQLELVNTIGKNGYGPKGLMRPTYCSFSNERNKLLVMDKGQKKIFLYSRVGRDEFTRNKESIPCGSLPFSMQLLGEKVYISAYTEDNGKPYSFFSVDLLSQVKTLLLPSHLKYNFTPGDFMTQYRANYIPAIGKRGFFAMDTDSSQKKADAYYVWEGRLRIIKIDTVSGEVDKKTLGQPDKNLKKAFPSQELVEGYRKGEFKAIQKARRGMSYVRNVFTTRDHLLVIYERPYKKGEVRTFLQYYSLKDRKFRKEVLIPGNPNRRMHFVKEKSVLYTLQGGPDGTEYSVNVYSIKE